MGDGEDGWDGIRVNIMLSKTICEFKMGASRGETAEGGEKDELVVGETLVCVEDGSRDDIFTLHILIFLSRVAAMAVAVTAAVVEAVVES